MGEKKRTLRGFLCAALGGVCWGASGTVGQYLFTCQGVDSHHGARRSQEVRCQ